MFTFKKEISCVNMDWVNVTRDSSDLWWTR